MDTPAKPKRRIHWALWVALFVLSILLVFAVFSMWLNRFMNEYRKD